MRYLKKFENYLIDNGPKVGDYIVAETVGLLGLKDLPSNVIDAINFVHSNVGYLTHIRDNDSNAYVVKYDFTDIITNQFDTKPSEFYFPKENIRYWSVNKEDAELFLESKKYNL